MAMALNDSRSDRVWDERRTERISAAERKQRMWDWISLGREEKLSPRLLLLRFNQRSKKSKSRWHTEELPHCFLEYCPAPLSWSV